MTDTLHSFSDHPTIFEQLFGTLKQNGKINRYRFYEDITALEASLAPSLTP